MIVSKIKEALVHELEGKGRGAEASLTPPASLPGPRPPCSKVFRGEILLPGKGPYTEADSGPHQEPTPQDCAQVLSTVYNTAKGEKPGPSWKVPRLLAGQSDGWLCPAGQGERDGQTQREKHKSRTGETDLRAQGDRQTRGGRKEQGAETDMHGNVRGNSERQRS